jgi:hypothetical protein
MVIRIDSRQLADEKTALVHTKTISTGFLCLVNPITLE